jgi:hypothetical protein
MYVLRVFVVTRVLAPLKIKYFASNHAIMDYVRNAFIGLGA